MPAPRVHDRSQVLSERLRMQDDRMHVNHVPDVVRGRCSGRWLASDVWHARSNGEGLKMISRSLSPRDDHTLEASFTSQAERRMLECHLTSFSWIDFRNSMPPRQWYAQTARASGSMFRICRTSPSLSYLIVSWRASEHCTGVQHSQVLAFQLRILFHLDNSCAPRITMIRHLRSSHRSSPRGCRQSTP